MQYKFTPCLKALTVLFLFLFVANPVLGASKVEKNAKRLQEGMSEKAMLEIMGSPVKFYEERGPLKRLAYDFCHYGMFKDHLVRVVTQLDVVISVRTGDMKAFGGDFYDLSKQDRRKRENSKYITKKLGCTKYFNDINFNVQRSLITAEKYDIDGLIIHTLRHPKNLCSFQPEIRLEGEIGPDSTFAMEALLEEIKDCIDDRSIQPAVVVRLESGGGLIRDGFALGKSLRSQGAIAVIDDYKRCASSCAIAFLGGVERKLFNNSEILFHAPYYQQRNKLGETVANCVVPQEILEELNDYYVEMVGQSAGDRLFDRTMSYCTASDGWVITGLSAAKLFKIATR